jgi:hypothetical protein
VLQEDVEVVREAHEAFNRPDLGVFDLEGFYRLADPDLVLEVALEWSRGRHLQRGSRDATLLEHVFRCL